MKSLREYARQYIWGIGEQPTKSKVTLETVPDTRSNLQQLSPEMYRKIAFREPMILKAITKKNKDIFRNWLTIKSTNENVRVPQKDLDMILDFDKRTHFREKLYKACVSSNIYGDGYLERTFINDTGSSDSPVDFEQLEPLNFNLLDTERINTIDKHPKKKDNILYYYYKDKKTSEDKYIHPDRILPVTMDSVPYSNFGVSKIHILANILESKMNADVSSGRILNWFGHGIPIMTIQNMNDEQGKKAKKYFETHPDYFIFDQDYSLDIANPTRIDPKPFYDYFFTNIASAMEMPVHILTGVQVGSLTGAEIGVADYYKDIENIQQLILTPLIEKVYKQLLESRGRKWKYNISWNSCFVDEEKEAKMMEKRTLCAVQAKINGIISIPEARNIMNHGVVDLDPDLIPEKDESDIVVPRQPFLPNVEPSKPKDKIVPKPLDEQQIKMIDDWKKKRREELDELEKRLK